MELKDIFELWDRFDASNVTEMEISIHGVQFSLKEGNGTEVKQCKDFPQTEIKTVETKETVQETSERAIAEIVEDKATKEETSSIKAPLVGTFYQAPAQNAQPFVKKGQNIKAGDVVGIIEAMKLMNEVVATVDGTVEDILVEDGEMVEFEQVLMTIK